MSLPLMLLCGLALCWTFAIPLFGVPDEPEHVVKAAAIVRGEFIGAPGPGSRTLVRVPRDLQGDPICFAFLVRVPASCQHPLHGTGSSLAPTNVGRYPPLYYLLTGWPSLLIGGDGGVYAMRVVSALLAACFLAGAFRSAVSSSRRRLLLPALGLACSPYVFYFAGAVNPSGLEMAASVCAWTTGLVLTGEAQKAQHRRLLIRFAFALAVLVQLRALGPVFVAVLLLALSGLHGLPAVTRLVVGRLGRQLLALGLASLALIVCWLALVGGLPKAGTPLPPHASDVTIWRLSLERYRSDLAEMVGQFGWSNTRPPNWTYVAWLTPAAVLIARGMRRTTSAALLVASIALPVALVALAAHHDGIEGQGRDWYPLVVGCLLVGGYIGGGQPRRWHLPAGAGIAIVTVLVSLVSVAGALNRYRFGIDEPPGPNAWNPPGGSSLLIAVDLAAAVAMVLWCYWSASPASPDSGGRGGWSDRRVTDSSP